MGMTISEKILANHSGKDSVRPGDYIWVNVDGTAITSVGIPQILKYKLDRVFDPERVYAVEDHCAPPANMEMANTMVEMRKIVKKLGITNFFEYGRHGIMHELFPQYGYISPGDLIAGIDSHTTSYGCYNVAACPIFEEAPYILATGKLWMRVPPSIKFVIQGQYPGPEKAVVGKDIILRILKEFGSSIGLYKSLEFDGPAVGAMSMASRFTISNMSIELGAKFGIFQCDEKTMDALKNKMKRPSAPVQPDADAVYEKIFYLDVTGMAPHVACPHDPSNSVPVTELGAKHIKIDQAFIGSCTNGRMEDFRMAAEILKGRHIHPDVRLIASPASQLIWKECLEEGLWKILMDAGAIVTHSTCGPCMGSHFGLLGDGETSISTTNRNFQGRQGSPKASVYLGNAATVAASAVEGNITDPRQFL
jgi:3-isopropylmalate/(R)-2-methylmalate dehydratase large subunit